MSWAAVRDSGRRLHSVGALGSGHGVAAVEEWGGRSVEAGGELEVAVAGCG
ncbi:Uncharacterised protein [Mycobacteroides abscessus subsp. massiliense]|nr:Uncharacterised protein [Mycobacteroides abscessus subsp. massiliense]